MKFWSKKKTITPLNNITSLDVELVLAARRGEKKAFVEIVSRYQAMVCGIALGILTNFTASEDAAQDAFLTAWKKIGDLRDPASLKSWLAQIARNSALAHLRRQRGHDPLDETIELPDESPSPADVASTEEEAELVRIYLAKLPENYRLPLVLYYREGQSVSAVAETLHISEDAVKQRLARGREMLKERMSGLLENVLNNTRPTAVFTVAIAVAIGAMAAPAVVAGTVFATATAAGTVATTADVSTRLFTLMSTSKNILIVSALVTAVCIPVGYTHTFMTPKAAENRPVTELAKITTNAPPSYEQSKLFAEWRHLHEIHGTNASAMPLLFDAISKLSDPSRRRIFRGALISEWAQLDAPGAFVFFSGKNGDDSQRKQFLHEWLTESPVTAINAVLSGGKVWDEGARDILSDVARLVPGKLAELAERVPKAGSYWDSSVRDAFAILSRASLQNAKSAAEKMSGDNREQALAGVAQTWAKSDLKQAIQWAKNLPSSVDQNEIIRSALIGRAEVDPASALEESGSVPSGGRSGYFATTTGARVLGQAAKTDFEGTMNWLANHPGRFTSDDLQGVANSVTDKLNAGATQFLDARIADGSLTALMPAIGSAILNDGSHQQSAIWEWLKDQPDNETTRSLKASVLNAASYKDPSLSLAMSKNIPPGPAGDLLVSQLARSLLNGGNSLGRMDSLLQEAPERVRQPLLENAFNFLQAGNMNDPSVWASRLQQLPEGSRSSGAQALARAWAEQEPENAIGWATTLKGDSRLPAVLAATTVWASSDPNGAARWVSSLNEGADRDSTVGTLVSAIADKHPAEAWEWALTIGNPNLRVQAAGNAAESVARHNPASARQWIEASDFSAEIKGKLSAYVANVVNKVPKH